MAAPRSMDDEDDASTLDFSMLISFTTSDGISARVIVTDAISAAKEDFGSIGINLPEDASFCIIVLTLVTGATERPTDKA